MKYILFILLVLFLSCKPQISDLNDAIEQDDTIKVERLINKGVDLYSEDLEHQPLSLAIKKGNLDIIKLLVSYDIELNLTTTDINYITYTNQIKILELFIDNGLSGETLLNENLRLLDWCHIKNYMNLFFKLLESGSNINLDIDGDGNNTFINVFKDLSPDELKYVIDNGADIYSVDSKGHNLWEILCPIYGQLDIRLADILWEAGLRFDMEDNLVLHYAVFLHQYDYVLWLLDHGVDKTIRDSEEMLAEDYTHIILKNYSQMQDPEELSRSERAEKADWLLGILRDQ